MTAAAAQQQANLSTLIAYGSQIKARNLELAAQNLEEPLDDLEPPCDVTGGPLWHSLDSQDNWPTLMNFHRYELLYIFKELWLSLPLWCSQNLYFQIWMLL